ncbi:MAG: tetratricopeptide repeat protein [Caldilineaceae bacterium]
MQADLLDQLELEHDNLRAALDWGLGRTALTDPKPAEAAVCRLQGARLAAILARFWYLRGHFYEGRSWLRRALDCVQNANPPAGSEDERQWIEARLLFGIGEVTAASENVRTALEPLERSIAIFRRLDNKRDLVFVLHRFGETLGEVGDIARSYSLIEEALSLARELDDHWLIGRSMSILSALSSEVGDYDKAESLANEALQLLRNGRDTGTVVYLLNILGQAAAKHGDYDRAESLLEEALTINRTVTRLRMGAAWTLRNLGMVAQRRGDLVRARALFAESLTLRYELRQLSRIAWALEGLAELDYAEEAYCRAVSLWAGAAAVRKQCGAALNDADRKAQERVLAELCGGLGEQVFNAAWQAGAKRPLDALVSYALAHRFDNEQRESANM